jgi:hypothetical protein
MNELRITADNLSEIEAFVKGEEDFDFQKIYPLEADDIITCSDAWGTKWNACNTYHYDDGYWYFDTAWGPSLGVSEKLSKIFPEATITHAYYEPGVAFVGVAEFKDGLISDECLDYSQKGYYETVFELGFEDESNFVNHKGRYYYLDSLGALDSEGNYFGEWDKSPGTSISDVLVYDAEEEEVLEVISVSEERIIFIKDGKKVRITKDGKIG